MPTALIVTGVANSVLDAPALLRENRFPFFDTYPLPRDICPETCILATG